MREENEIQRDIGRGKERKRTEEEYGKEGMREVRGRKE